MKKIILIALVLVTFSISCSSDDSSGSASVLLTKTIRTFDDGTVETTHLVYNGNKLVEQTFDSGRAKVTYIGNLIAKIEYFYGEELVQENTYQYDSSQRLISFERYEYSQYGDYTTESDYVYNSNGTVSFIIRSGNVDFPLSEKKVTFTLNSFG